MTLESLDESRLKLLFELSRRFVEHTDLDSLLKSVVKGCRAVFGTGANVAVMLLDPATDELYFPYVDIDKPVHWSSLQDVRIPAGQGISGSVLRKGRSELIVDASRDPRFGADVAARLKIPIGSILAVPLKTRDGTVGLMTISGAPGSEPWTKADLAFLESLASYVALAVENAQIYERLRSSEADLRLEIGALRRDLERRDLFPEIIGTSPAMRELIRLMESAAQSPISVLIEGETGTGKELVSRGVHRASPRGNGPFLAVNCGAFTETLLEAELFGHERGAFTGADRARRGLFETLSGGSILLDEVGEMPPAMQVKLLRVLQEGEVIPVGATSGRKVDVRIISASNAGLEAQVARGRFRSDLYYRLAAFPIHVPRLAERRGDIPALTDHFLQLAAAKHEKQIVGISPEARALLLEYDWPGNVRQLKNEIERAVALAQPGDRIEADSLSETVRGARALPAPAAMAATAAAVTAASPSASGAAARTPATAAAPEATAKPGKAPATRPLREARVAFEARYIQDVLEREGGNVSRAASVLGISRVMLHKKLKLLGLR